MRAKVIPHQKHEPFGQVIPNQKYEPNGHMIGRLSRVKKEPHNVSAMYTQGACAQHYITESKETLAIKVQGSRLFYFGGVFPTSCLVQSMCDES